MRITAGGERRFRLLRTRVQRDQLLLGEVETLPEPVAPKPGPSFLERRALLARLIEALGDRHEIGAIELDDPLWVSYRLAELLPLANAERQRLLEHPEFEGEPQGLVAAIAHSPRRSSR